MCLQLRARGVCCPQVLDVRSCRVSRESFRNIRWNRQRRLARLVAERRLFVTWKSFRNPMTAHREVYRLLPDKQFTEGLKLRHFLQMSRLDATRNTMGFDTGGRRRKNRKATLRLG